MLGAKYRLAVIKRPRVLLALHRHPCGADVNIWSKGQKGLFPYLFMSEALVSRLKGCHPSQLSVGVFHQIAFCPGPSENGHLYLHRTWLCHRVLSCWKTVLWGPTLHHRPCCTEALRESVAVREKSCEGQRAASRMEVCKEQDGL